MENNKLMQICSTLFLLFISMAVLAQAAAPFESIVQKDAKKTVPFESLAQSNNQSGDAAANGKIPFESMAKNKDLSGLAEASKEDNKKTNIDWIYVGMPIFLVIGLLFYVEFKRRKDHIQLTGQSRQNKINSLRYYVGTNLRKGYGKEDIRNALSKNNYNSQEIQEAFRGVR